MTEACGLPEPDEPEPDEPDDEPDEPEPDEPDPRPDLSSSPNDDVARDDTVDAPGALATDAADTEAEGGATCATVVGADSAVDVTDTSVVAGDVTGDDVAGACHTDGAIERPKRGNIESRTTSAPTAHDAIARLQAVGASHRRPLAASTRRWFRAPGPPRIDRIDTLSRRGCAIGPAPDASTTGSSERRSAVVRFGCGEFTPRACRGKRPTETGPWC